MSRLDEIEAAIRTGDSARCIRALEGASEAERQRLYPRIAEIAAWDTPAVLARDRERRLARNSSAMLAIYGTATFDRIRKLRGAQVQPEVSAVLIARKPAWLNEWARWTLSRPRFPHFHDVRRLIREGLIEKPESEDYLLGVIFCLAPRGRVRERMREDPDVFACDIWKFFDIGGTRRASLAAVDKAGGGWKDGLVELAGAGLIDRNRLLDRSLDASSHGFPPFRARWFSGLHDALEPAVEETAARCPRYLALLGSRTPATVSFAMRIIASLHKAGRLPPSEACARIAPALRAPQKGVVSAALRVLERISQDHPGLAAAAARAVEEARRHTLPAIRMNAAGAFETAAGIAGEPVPVLPRPRAVEPIRNLDDLIETFATVIEEEEPPSSIERVLDGVARLHGVRPKRFEALTAHLVERAAKLPGAVLSPLLMAWTRGVRPRFDENCAGLISFLWARVHETAERTLRARPAPLAALPSDESGAVDPLALVARLRENPDPGALDLIQGLLRLSPENRAEALAEAAAVPGESGRAVRYALGGEEKRTRAASSRGLWTAAAQARQPASGLPRFSLQWRPARYPELPGPGQSFPLLHLETSQRLQVRRDHPGDLTANPGTQDASMLRWCATVWPWNREGFYAAGAQELVRNLDWMSAEWGNAVYLETLAADVLPLGPMGYELLALGLACKESGEATAASTALIHGLASGRVSGKRLGETCARLAGHGIITISRWTKRLGAAARIRRSFAQELFTVQDRLLAAAAPIATNELPGFLELLCELRWQSGLDLSREARSRLAHSPSGGKSGRLVKSLL